MHVSVIIVSWNVRELLRRCLSSVYASRSVCPGLELDVLVVDNASADGTAAMIRSEFPDVRLVVNTANLGFAAANNQGMRLAKAGHIMLLNPDTEVRDNAIGIMASYLDEHPGVGVVGPKLLNPDGTTQSSRRRFPTLATAFVESTILQRYIPKSRILTRYYFLDRPDDAAHDVDWLVGACLLVRREVTEKVGTLDEGFFMYSEEVDWCYRTKQAGWRIVYLPEAKVVHFYGQSSEKDLTSRHIHFNTSKYKFFRKHYGLLRAELLRMFLLGTYLFQIVEEGTKLALGHKRRLRRQRLALLWRVVQSRLTR